MRLGILTAVMISVLAAGKAGHAEGEDLPQQRSGEASATHPSGDVPLSGPAAERLNGFLAMYCVDCHGAVEPEAELSLADLGQTIAILEDRDRWLRVVHMLRSREMPPEDELQPEDEQRGQIIELLEDQLENFDCSQQPPQPGRVTIRRLNRVEYNNTIRDLVGIDFQPARDFPADNVGSGFDNLADVLSLPPLLMEKYLQAAETIVTRAWAEEAVREQILFCQPSAALSDEQCARQILERFATRAFRRPVREQELDRLVQLFLQARQDQADFQQAIGLALQAVLVSPHFLFRIELAGEGEAAADGIRRLNGYELATRLSYFLWSSMPDDELFQQAAAGRLHDGEVLAAQVRRMLHDEKAQALVQNFAGQWLELRNLAKVSPDPDRYSEFDEELRQAMRRETELFFESVMRQDRSILDFLDSNYTFVNERLARHYGIEGVTGPEFRQVQLPDRRRGGILSQASILTLTSNPTRTSPVKRGKWILENILGTPPPPPPPGVEELEDGEQSELLGSLRERMQQHRSDPSCAVCHRKMDALGFGFENFDAIGAWRDQDGPFAIDASGELPGDLAFRGPDELRTILKTTQRDQFVRCLVEKMLTYALGREIKAEDRCAVDQIMVQVEESDYRFSSLILGVVHSDPFQLQGPKGDLK